MRIGRKVLESFGVIAERTQDGAPHTARFLHENEFGRAGISTGVLALSCAPDDVPKLVDVFSPSR